MVPKFRAWNGYRKIMADYVSAIQNGDTQGTPSSVNVIVNGKNETWDIENDHVELLQFTGLKDANGKEIYEGDILLYQEDYGDGFFAPVIYGSENLYYPAFDLDWHYIPKNYFFESNAISEGVANDRLIVAGNIHTNLELLEADK